MEEINGKIFAYEIILNKERNKKVKKLKKLTPTAILNKQKQIYFSITSFTINFLLTLPLYLLQNTVIFFK